MYRKSNLFGIGGDFQKAKFKNGIISSFVKTGTLTVNYNEVGTPKFMDCKEEFICGTMKVIPLGTRPCDYFDLVAPEMNLEAGNVQNMILTYVDRKQRDNANSNNNDNDDDDDDDDACDDNNDDF